MLATGNKVLLKVSVWPWKRPRNLASAYLSVPSEVDLQCLPVVLESERGHSEQDVFTVHGLALLLLAFLRSWWSKVSITDSTQVITRAIGLRTFTGDEGYELGHAFLHAFFRLFGDLGVLWQS